MLATQLFWQTQPVIAPPPLTGFQPAHHLCFLTSLAPLNLKVSPLLNGFIYQGGKEEILLVYVLMIVHCRMQPHLFIFVPMPFQLAINRIPIKEWVDS